MASLRAIPRLPVGSAAWVADERNSALSVAEEEAEGFTFSARNEIEWLNEHMIEIFNKDPVNVVEFFKTPGKLRGKTPRTVRQANLLEVRAPLSDIFSNTPRGGGLSPIRQAHFNLPVSTFRVAEDAPTPVETEQEAAPIASVEDEPLLQKSAPSHFDSGYFGSQYTSQTQSTQPYTQLIHVFEEQQSPEAPTPKPMQNLEEVERVKAKSPRTEKIQDLQERRSIEKSFHSAKEECSLSTAMVPEANGHLQSSELHRLTRPILESPLQNRAHHSSPQKTSPQKPTPTHSPAKSFKALDMPQPVIEDPVEAEDEPMEDVQSPSEGSSPIRLPGRKGSLNFASLPARERIDIKKSIGNRVSHINQLEQTRTSCFGRQTGGKSLGNVRQDEAHDDDDDDDMDVDGKDQKESLSRLHSKTSTQRLQDQISMLGKSQAAGRPTSKSIASSAAVSSQTNQPNQPPSYQDMVAPESLRKSPQRSPLRNPFRAPGAFPEDEEDSWIGPPNAAPLPSVFSPRPGMTKSHTTDVMEGIHGKDSIGGSEFNIPKRGESPRHRSPMREPTIPERTTSTLSHMKSVSTSVLRSPKKAGESPAQKKPICVSNPEPSIHSEASNTPPKSPSRSYRGSPLKAAKDKFSSILKTSKGLFASSAAVSADAKTSTMSPAASRVGLHSQPSYEDSLQGHPYLSNGNKSSSQLSQKVPDSPVKASVRKTRASTEREERRKEEETRELKEAKEARKMVDQLEKARQKVKDEARVYHLQQERVAAMEKEVNARKEQEKLAKASQVSIPKATRTSPRKTKAQLEAEGIAAAAIIIDSASGRDVDMANSSSMPPPAVPRSKSQISRPVTKRAIKPGKDATGKPKPPTMIKVHVGHQYHPSNSTLAATLQDSLPSASQANSLRKKPSTSSIASTSSTKVNSFKSNPSKVLEAAAKKKEQDELVAKRKREAKEENERQRAAIKEEERRKDEQHRRQELDRKRAIEREKEQAAQIADAKKSASRQAMEKKRLDMERAKQVGAPPPALRPQPSGDLDKPLPSVPREYAQPKAPHMSSSWQRSQDEGGRPLMTTKVPPKRPLQQDNIDDHHSRPTVQRNPPSYQHNENNSKRRKTSETFDDDDDMTESRPKMTAPPIRQSSSRPKDMQPKSIFPTGYAAAPQPANLQRLAVQNNQTGQKPTHSVDMGQFTKAPIPFAPTSNNAIHKTPTHPGNPQAGAKSANLAARSSPRYPNGDNIELPEINTDSEDDDDDDDDDDHKCLTKSWTDSPQIRKQIAIQEDINPADIFGQPAPLDMEEVFNKSKDRFHKFRQRTSSANWNGQDRLTDDDIRKDLEGRKRIRREGGWTADSIV